MAASITDSVVKSKGRINYIEPNDFPEYVEKQKYNITDPNMHLDNISWNPEDLQYSVDLQVIIGDRYNENSAVKTKMYGAGTWVSFMEGSTFTSENKEEVKYLTDAYTEISFQEFSNNGISQKESLGIDSIEINFDSHFFPLVTMKFTDVRAAALFGPSEYEYLQKERAMAISNDKKLSEEEKEKQLSSLEKTSGSFFKSLFRFPYPRFMLSIMGFYGDKVTFQLAVNDFKTNFNSQNGNFDVTVSFIGYMYGLYTDIPMSIVMLAPYFYRDYWENKKSSGEFTYCDDGKQGNPILTFIEFLEKYHKMYQDINIGENSNKIKEYKYICNKKTCLNSILDAYNKFEGQFTGINEYGANKPHYINNDLNPYATATQLLIVGNKPEYEINSNLFGNLNKLIVEYNSEYADSSNKIVLNEKLSLFLNKDKCEFEKINKQYGSKTIRGTLPNNSTESLIKQFNNFIENNTKEINGNKTEEYSYFFILDRGKFKDELTERIKKIEGQITKAKNDSDSVMNEIMQTSLTFKPTIENIYRMIFAHIETFISSFDRDIVKTISNKKTERTCIKLGLTEENSDIPYGTKRGDTFVPPFPLCKEKGGEVRYPGTFFEIPQLNTIDEVVYVDKIVNGIEQFTDAAKKALEKIRSIEEGEQYIPYKMVTVTDIFYNGKNPYKVLKEQILKAQNDVEKTQLIEYFFYSRFIMDTIAQEYDSNNGVKLRKPNTDKIKEDIEKEFNNFSEVGIVINNNIKSNLKKIVLDNVSKNKSYTYTEKEKLRGLSTGEYYCYFTKDPFENNISNEFIHNNGKKIHIIDDRYYPQVKKLSEDEINIITTDEITRLYGGNNNDISRTNRSKDEYNLSYVLPNDIGRETIGFYGDFRTNGKTKDLQTFSDLKTYSDNTQNQKFKEFQSGILQVGYLSKESSEIITLYNGTDGHGKKDIMNEQTNPLLRAFFFLGSICSYFCINKSFPNIDSYSKCSIVEFPKMLLLYYGACLYFTENGFANYIIGDIDDNEILKKLKEYKPHIIDSSKEEEFITFTSYRNLFLDVNTSKKTFKLPSINENKEILKTYFKNWAENEFTNIDNKFKEGVKNSTAIKKTILRNNIENNYTTYHDKDIIYYEWRTNSDQNTIIKELLCKNIYLFIEPNGGRILYTDIAEEALREKFYQIKTEEDINEEQRKELEKNETNKSEYKKALYYTLKTLYDKWLTSYKLDGSEEKHPFRLHNPNEDYNSRNERFHPINNNGDGGKNNTEFNNFIFVDSFYRDISNKFLVNPTIVCEVINGYIEGNVVRAQTSVFEFMNEIAEKNNLLFVSIPVYNNLYSREGLLKIFTPNRRLTELGYKGSNDQITIPGNTYMLMYTGEASSKLNLGDECGYEGDGIDIQDIFELPESKVPADLNEIFKVGEEYKNEENTDYNIPAFGVTYARQNQMYFKDITVNMDNPKVTDYSIANLIQISYGGKHGDLDSYNVGVGQDIYSIYSNRSYTCTVEMLGCLNIMPMMYFQLNNIPMFRGVYIIINVSHSIVPGNITTRFTGVRVSKNHIGEVKIIFDYQRLFEKLDITDDDFVLTQSTNVAPCEGVDFDIPIGKKNHFKLSYFISCTKAIENKICNLPYDGEDTDKVKNLDILIERFNEFCNEILDPLYEACEKELGYGFNISSGYRNTKLNAIIKGSSSSAHMYGYAVDLQCKRIGKNNDFKIFVYNWLNTNRKGKFDQFINEFRKNKDNSISSWVHIGYKYYNTKTGEFTQRGENLCYKSWRKNQYTRINSIGDMIECNN